MTIRVISGGQTGADQAGLCAAKALGIPTGGYAPSGWETEDGPAPWLADYGLIELIRADYATRTRANVEEANAILWFGNPSSPGGLLTLKTAAKYKVPFFVPRLLTTEAELVVSTVQWVREIAPTTLMVAGNRESKAPGIGKWVERFLGEVLSQLIEEAK